MYEPSELEEYIRESEKFWKAANRFMDAAHKSTKDTARLYDRLSEACKSHQRVTANACAFAREVIETRDPDLAERHKSQLGNYINRKHPVLGVMENKGPTRENEPTCDLYALRRLQEKPEQISQFEQKTGYLKNCLAELANTLEQWNALYRELYIFVMWDGHP